MFDNNKEKEFNASNVVSSKLVCNFYLLCAEILDVEIETRKFDKSFKALGINLNKIKCWVQLITDKNTYDCASHNIAVENKIQEADLNLVEFYAQEENLKRFHGLNTKVVCLLRDSLRASEVVNITNYDLLNYDFCVFLNNWLKLVFVLKSDFLEYSHFLYTFGSSWLNGELLHNYVSYINDTCNFGQNLYENIRYLIYDRYYNPNHDERGRFAPKPKSETSSSSAYVPGTKPLQESKLTSEEIAHYNKKFKHFGTI